ncbi:DUF974-domain-containing protein [Suillus clintonianus]|uniref:DUF974-domain-containing protein n=1 Tax=Suillus clintonianus TaxID=1904413 RepID=UPI001B8839EA|nr:DUF974-domain-containing protein [Suillus clintonianus]KAG2149304.1 DUF974-domain-containing protein [Suillus clintonianus]
MDGQGHLLSLKVMRVSRPSLASAWQPFYSSSPSFSAHSTASILSLQGKTPLPGHPKTLRDLTQASEFLTLPASFGAIQLGETFSSCICINNETNVDIEGVSVRVEIQTANSKILVAELGGPGFKLAVGDLLEYVAHHEVKELGHHVLACIVSYHLPPSYRYAPGDSNPSHEATFRKFYKFAVTNPLSVKTKVHTPRSPSALMTSLEREKVFLEVHIQNMTQDAMWVERMEFECAEGWSVADANTIPSADDDIDQKLFSGSMALMQPQAIRQYIYILTPTTSSSFPVVHPAGSVIPLGRLDISWRSQFGEPGRLLTSMLSRRFPGPPPAPNPNPASAPPLQHPVSALPPYLQRTVPSAPSSPARPRSPQLPPSRPSSPTPAPYRPGSPFRTRPMSGPSRPQSPAAGSISNVSVAPNQQLPASLVPAQVSAVEVDVIINHIPRDSVAIEQPFKIAFTATVSAALPKAEGKQRIIFLAVQHLQYPLSTAITYPEPFQATETISSRFSSLGLTSATSTLVTPVQSSPNMSSDNPLVVSPEKMLARGRLPTLPSPYFEFADEEKRTKLKGCVFVGSSTQVLSPITLTIPSHDSDHEDPSDDHVKKVEGSQEFELTFLPVQTGFVRAGGLRILLIRDELIDVGADQAIYRLGSGTMEARTMKELDVVAELWVHS